MKLFKEKYPLGVIAPDYKDIRDYQLAEIQPEAVELPEEFCLRDKMTSVQKQNYGTCTSHMADGIAEFWNSQEYRKEIKLSQKFIYHNTKKISGLWNIQGDYVRNAMLSVCKYGACLEKTYPDDRQRNWEEYVKQKPPEKAYKEAEKYKGKTCWRVSKSLDNFRQAIYQNKCPVGFGMMWYESYRKITSDGRLPLPGGKELGGHAIDAIDWVGKKLRIRNSWGPKWGNNGYFYIPFNEFDKHTIWDCWVLLDEKGIPNIHEGWVAIKYLTNVKGYKTGTQVKTVYRLNLRVEPSVKSPKLLTMDRNQECTVLDDKVVDAGGYEWQKIRVKLN